MTFQNKSLLNEDVTIEYLDNQVKNSKTTLIASMGLWEPAERALPMFNLIRDRRCISFSYRGRGNSDTPESGYDSSHHATDLKSVVDACDSDQICLFGFSKGVSYLLEYCHEMDRRVAGLILVDAPAIHIKPDKGYADYWKDLVYLDMPIVDYVRPETLDGIERESTFSDYSVVLEKITVPVNLFYGTNNEAAIPSNITKEDIATYEKTVSQLTQTPFHKSGHMIMDEELEKCAEEVEAFLNLLDSATQ